MRTRAEIGARAITRYDFLLNASALLDKLSVELRRVSTLILLFIINFINPSQVSPTKNMEIIILSLKGERLGLNYLLATKALQTKFM
jgi:hypothetical protein